MKQVISILKLPQTYFFIALILGFISFNLYQENNYLDEKYYNLSVDYNKSLNIIDNLEDDIVKLNKKIVKFKDDLYIEKNLNKNLTTELNLAEDKIKYLEENDTFSFFNFNINIISYIFFTLIFLIPFSFTLFDFNLNLFEIKIKSKNLEKVINLFKLVLILFIIFIIIFLLERFLN